MAITNTKFKGFRVEIFPWVIGYQGTGATLLIGIQFEISLALSKVTGA